MVLQLIGAFATRLQSSGRLLGTNPHMSHSGMTELSWNDDGDDLGAHTHRMSWRRAAALRHMMLSSVPSNH